MKYLANYQPYSWNQAQNSTQNSSSNMKQPVSLYRSYNHKIHKKSTRRKRKTSFYSSISSNGPSVSSFSTEEKGHYQFFVGQILGGIYQITKLLGEGTFGRVVEAEAKGKKYAIKIIRPVDRYIHSAKIQKNILKEINARDKNDDEGLVRYVHSFYHNDHFCLAFKPLGKSLYDVLKMNQYKGFSMKMVQSFFKQILRSIGFLHKIGYTHTDLKPQNILLEQQDLLQYEGWTEDTKQIYLPKSDKVKVIDFGGATKFNEFHSSVICTRQYRPPEVILKCCQWNELADVWSIGCIISELLTGNLLFHTHDDFEHLILIEKNSGSFPFWMVKKAESQFREIFEKDRISYQKAEKHLSSWRTINNFKSIQELFADHSQLIDLLQRCLQIDPNRRINCKTAVQHPFFQIKYQ